MSASDPEDAIVEWLRRTRGAAQRIERRDSSPPVAFVAWRGGHPFDADLDSVRIIKARATERRRLYAVVFRDTSGGRWTWTLPVDMEPDGDWTVAGGAGGGGAPPLLAVYGKFRTRLTSGRRRGRTPWANLGGGNWPERFYAGGRIEHDRGRTANVRLTCANGLVLTDSVDDGWVLFLTERRAETPVVVELLDDDGALIASHRAFEHLRQT